MSLVKHPGTYIARPINWTIKFEEGKCPRFAMVFECEQFRDGGKWVSVTDERITGFFTLFNRDNSPNEINLRALKDALGWDGSSLESLEKTDWADKEVQIVVEEGEYNGESRLEVRYLNPRDYQGGMGKSDPQVVQQLDQKYGPVLRALFGTKKSANGSQSGGSTTTLTRPALAAPNVSPTDAAKQATWKAFIDLTPGYETGRRVEVFKDVVKQLIPTKEAKDCNAEDWQFIGQEINSRFSAEIGGLIPF